MAQTVIDSLVVTLGLDPKQFGVGVTASDKKLDAFNKKVKALGVNEEKLDVTQKKALKSLRDLAVQSTRTGKELAETSSVGEEFWSIMKTGAVGFGTALGLNALKDFTTQSMQANAAMTRLGPNMGLAAKEADAWGKAVSTSVNGNAQAALGTLQELSNALQKTSLGIAPTQWQAAAAIASRYTNGRPISLYDANHKARSAESVLLDFADPLKAMGPQKAQAFGSEFGLDPDMINFLDRGRSAVESDLAKARKQTLTDKQFLEDEKLRQATSELSTAFTHLKDQLVVGMAPRLTRDMKQALATMRLATGKISWSEYQKEYQDAEDQFQGPHGAVDRKAAQAYDILKSATAPGLVPPMFKYGEAAPAAWTDEQKRDRLRAWVETGKSPAWAAEHVFNEMQKGAPPSAPPNGGSTGPRGLQDNNPGNLMFAGQDGAIGDSYTSPDGKRRTMARFGSTAAGMEALKAQLRRYFAAGNNTIQAIYAKYAPASDGNPTDAGIQHISQWSGFAPGAALQSNQATIDALAAAIARQETGYSATGGDTTIHQTGPVTINVPTGDPKTIAGGWHKAVVQQAQLGPS